MANKLIKATLIFVEEKKINGVNTSVESKKVIKGEFGNVSASKYTEALNRDIELKGVLFLRGYLIYNQPGQVRNVEIGGTLYKVDNITPVSGLRVMLDLGEQL
jgi:hypothetical protein